MTDKEIARIVHEVTAALTAHINEAVARELNYAVHQKVMTIVSGRVDAEIRSLIRNRIEDSVDVQIVVRQK